MCSWCWGYQPAWAVIQNKLNNKLNIQYVMGGLAPDSDQPMPIEMQNKLRSTWQKIQQVIPNTQFNFEFWTKCSPRRSTYPSCRAVLAAKYQQEESEKAMIRAIQEAYYLHAKNPSDNEVLIDLAVKIGLDKKEFTYDIDSDFIRTELDKNIQLFSDVSRMTGVQGFPSLALHHENRYYAVPQHYTNPQATLDFLKNV
jgi:putative protein-disulfide isomerase